MRRLLSSALVVTLWGGVGLAQPVPSRATGAAHASSSVPAMGSRLARAFTHLDRREFVAAEQAFAALLNEPGLSTAEQATMSRGLGAALFEQNRRVEAGDALARALAAATAVGDRTEQGWARRYLGALRYGEGHGDQARALWNAAREDFVASGDARGEFQALDDLALLMQGLEQRPLVERCYAIALAERDPLLEARVRRRWGQALLTAARPGPALVELERAVALMQAPDATTRAYLTDALAILGWALRVHGARERAVPVHREAIRLAGAAGDLNSQMWNYHGLGVTLTELGRYQDAEVAMRRALDLARKMGAATDIRLIAESLGWIAVMRHDWAHAVVSLESTLALPGVEMTATPQIHLARAYRGLKRLDDALAMANRAVDVSRRLGLVDNELRALIELAQTQEAADDLEGAQGTLNNVVDRLEAYRAELAPIDFLKQGFGERFDDAYGFGVRLQMRRGRAADALATAERVRSRAFADLLAKRRVKEAEEAETESGAWALGGGDGSRPASGTPADSPRSLAAMDSGAFGALAKRLATTIVVYWIHDAGSYAWVVQPDAAIHAVALTVTPADLRRAVRRAADEVPEVAINRSSSGQATAVVGTRTAYRTLYQQVWAPIARWLPQQADARITVIPHGPLFALPFGALLDGRGRYVIERYSVHYAASGAVLADAAQGTRKASTSDARRLLVADPLPLPAVAGGVRLPRLAAARAEVRTIASMMGAGADQLVGGRASETSVRAALPGARVAHFATHAIVRDDDPLGSYLMLGAGGAGAGAAEQDGRLTASEVAGLSLNADLVVLGACRSARGLVSSDGIAGLTRAFMTAGAPSLVATLWDVADRPTARVMTRFYAGYLTGVSKDRALRAAQLGLLHDLRAGRVRRTVGETTLTYAEHPHLWAGAILIGAP